jgi:hypothetical protein
MATRHRIAMVVVVCALAVVAWTVTANWCLAPADAGALSGKALVAIRGGQSGGPPCNTSINFYLCSDRYGMCPSGSQNCTGVCYGCTASGETVSGGGAQCYVPNFTQNPYGCGYEKSGTTCQITNGFCGCSGGTPTEGNCPQNVAIQYNFDCIPQT